MVYVKKVLAGILSSAMVISATFALLPGKVILANDAVPIDAVHFPDEKFREILKQSKYDTNQDGSFDDTEIAKLTYLDVSEKGIASVAGLEYLTNLENFRCIENAISSIDVSKNTKLVSLALDSNGLKSLDVSKNAELQELFLNDNLVTSLDLSGCKELNCLCCSNNPISSLDISKNPALCTLMCENCNLTSLDLSNNPLMGYLHCGFNNIATLDLRPCPNLRVLWCNVCNTQSIDVSKCVNLEIIHCAMNKLTSLDLSHCEKLEEVYCAVNEITSLDLSHNPELTFADIGINPYSSLDVSHNPKLYGLDCGYTNITSLDVSKNPEMSQLVTNGSLITSLDVSHNPKLHWLECMGSQIEDLYINTNPILLDLVSRKNRELCADEDGMEYYSHAIINEEESLLLVYDIFTILHTEATEPSFGDFVERLYTVALGRASEAEGKAYWMEQVGKKGLTGADCARFFLLDSPEFMNRNLPDDEFVETLYKTFFGRASEADGKAYWLGRLASGSTKAELVNDFIESTEWCDICATYGVKSGAVYHQSTKPSNNAVRFAARLYTKCLNRFPDYSGLDYWSMSLTNLEATGYQAASSFFTLPEFVGLKTTNEEYLTRLYRTFMGREPETEGFNYWLGLLNGGMDRNEAMKAFAGCPEFQEICNRYGIERGEI
ncbi:MAG: DUF4214 domain-containing protein [Clostridiales bacterium]|nr:DUF4214 domain-containing protein [Clostridiales bacterium]